LKTLNYISGSQLFYSDAFLRNKNWSHIF